jgi:arylsulfatase
VQNVAEGVMPPIKNRDYTITADLDVPDDGADGVIVALADKLGGFSFFVQDGKLRHTYSFMGVEVYKQVAEDPLPTGRKLQVQLDFVADAAVLAPSGTVTLSVDGDEVASGRMDHTVPIIFAPYQGMDIGRDNGEVVDPDYQAMAPFPFAGTIEKVVFDVRPPGDADAHAELHQAQHAGAQARHIDS